MRGDPPGNDARGKAVSGTKVLARRPVQLQRRRLSALVSLSRSNSLSGKFTNQADCTQQKTAITSRWATVRDARRAPIGKKIIGPVVASQRRLGRSRVGHSWGTLPLLHEPSREHRDGVLLDPLVEKRSNLLAEIGSVAEPGEFEVLERSARRRKQELPRRLSLLSGGQGEPPEQERYVSTELARVKNTNR